LNRGALAEMRTLLLELRPAALVDTELKELLRQLADAVTGREGVPVTVMVEDERDLPTDVHIALYRIAQEALNNVVKHARASHVEVGLRFMTQEEPPRHQEEQTESMVGAECVELWVKDDGRGFDPDNVPPDHLGLGIMRERAEAIGAAFEVKSKPGEGTVITVMWEEDEGVERISNE
jgi:signal transduction histidine kinase